MDAPCPDTENKLFRMHLKRCCIDGATTLYENTPTTTHHLQLVIEVGICSYSMWCVVNF
jgi:hypothetical protein